VISTNPFNQSFNQLNSAADSVLDFGAL